LIDNNAILTVYALSAGLQFTNEARKLSKQLLVSHFLLKVESYSVTSSGGLKKPHPLGTIRTDFYINLEDKSDFIFYAIIDDVVDNMCKSLRHLSTSCA